MTIPKRDLAGISEKKIKAYRDGLWQERTDPIAQEEPLDIRVVTTADNQSVEHGISVTMRTPGDDEGLALGFLFTEGVIKSPEWVDRMARGTGERNRDNVMRVFLKAGVVFDTQRLSRHVFTSSSCGICGRVTIERLRADQLVEPVSTHNLDPSVLQSLPNRLKEVQPVFSLTGGLHGCALFKTDGQLIAAREDIGRHNALDKLVGHLLHQGLPASDTILLLSGRASFELIQKALYAGIPYVASVGAPSSLAVELAESFGLCLIGFLRQDRFNVYTREEMIG